MIRARLFCVVVVAGCTAPPPDTATAPPPVRVTSVAAAMATLPRYIEAGGVVQARATATLSSRIVAPVERVLVAPEARVRAGQAVIQLDGRDLDAHARRAAASVGAHEQAVDAARADLDAARASLSVARAAHGRVVQLHAGRAATPRDMDEAVGALRAAEAHDAAAAARLRASESALLVSREAATAAGVTASFATVAAPFDGVVTEVLVDPGDLASPGTPLARVEDVRAFRVEVQVDESQAAAIDTKAPVHVVMASPAFGESSALTGRVVEMSRAADAGAHTFLIKIEIPAQGGGRAGGFARARFDSAPRRVLAIPASAIVARGQLSTVFVVAEGRVRMRVVRVGVQQTEVEVLAGLASGDQVVIDPPASLRDGDRVLARAPGSN